MLDVIIVVSYVMLPIILGGIFAIIKIKFFSPKNQWNIGYFFCLLFSKCIYVFNIKYNNVFMSMAITIIKR